MVGRIFCAYVYGSGQNSGLIQGVRVDDQDVLSYTYDELARTSTRTLNLGTDFTTSFEYLDGNTPGSTTALVSKMTNGNVSWLYTYDSRGNIETISRQEGTGEPVQQVKYYYDELNQLVREDNVVENKTIAYTYDAGGNILYRKIYAYTNGELGNPPVFLTYQYGDSDWKDKLTNFNGSNITYDEIGNPLSYRGNTLTWQHGRQLASLNRNGLSVSYTYDDSGIRTSKTVNGTKTQYYLNGSTILTQITGDDRFDFFYDDNGLLLGFSYNGEKYYYIRNLQSDIIGILNSSGNQVVSYTYDSWGKLLSIEGSAKDTIGVQNPFRYRGYYYDTETGFYYLNSRYYDPAVGRFLNADKILGALGEINQSNVFAYCGNNPILLCDANGEFATTIAGTLIGIGSTNIWNPIGWIALAVAGFFVTALAINSNVTNSQSSKSNAVARAQMLIYSASATSPPPPPNHGGRGTQTTSTTVFKNNNFRIDVENPGNRVGQIHLQKDGIKYYYNVGDRTFRIGSSSGELAPRSIQRLLEDPDVIIAIGKGLRILGY